MTTTFSQLLAQTDSNTSGAVGILIVVVLVLAVVALLVWLVRR